MSADPRRGVRLALEDHRAFGLDALPLPPRRSAPPAPPTLSTPEGATPEAATPEEADLRTLESEVSTCTRCRLCESRTRTVFGEGAPDAALMFVGEGPGADEDRTGRPFVGRAGQLLDRMIEAMTLSRDDVYIANVVKCRPPGNRAPNPDEAAACLGYLRAQIARIRPRVICALGSPAAKTLLETERGIMRLRGQRFPYPGDPTITVIPTFHPAYLLRRPEEKGKAWADLQMAMTDLGLRRP